jgi:hypothetical protein
MGGGQEASNVTDIEADEMEEHLRGLATSSSPFHCGRGRCLRATPTFDEGI